MSMMKKEEKDGLESFSKRIETRIKSGIKGTDSMERLICRLLTGKDPKIAAHLATKWVEWRYGKPTEKIDLTLNYTEALQKMRSKREHGE